MLLHFYLRYSTKFGDTIYITGNDPVLGGDNIAEAFPLEYLNDQLWHGMVEIDTNLVNSPVQYKYFLRDDNGEETIEFGDDRIIDIENTKAEKIILFDTWNNPGEYENAFFTSAFQEVLLKKYMQYPAAAKEAKTYTHEFKVKAPLLKGNESLCLSGSAKIFSNWDKNDPLLMTKSGNWWNIKLNLADELFPITYKYGIYNQDDKKFVRFEEGVNRILLTEPAKKSLTIIHDGFANLQNINWKGAGVAIPVFSLRSKKSFGTGEFADLNLLVDWAKKTGLKMIQILPVNDTISTHQDKDSYPYSAISAFALHPLYLNLEEVAGKKDAGILKSLVAVKKQLNAAVVIDYSKVMQLKLDCIKQLYKEQKENFKNDIEYFKFFELNRHWLVPYAAFSYLRDKFSNADFTTWKENAVYNDHEIQQLVSPGQNHYDEIALHYFTQYHLHLQLKAASAYAHRNGVIIKGDIPIGICRNSVDAWMNPSLYHMDEQAGAPPDIFTGKGQNWGFPTYNWEKMQGDNFAWWRSRFEQMQNYFDAFRIDHILGFFRIWSIPATQVEGIMGRFIPALPVTIHELFKKNISFERHRYTEPFINDSVLRDLFGKKATSVKKTFLNDFKLKEAFNTQQKVENYFSKQKDPDNTVKSGLFDLISNVILFEEENSQAQKFHFRIGMEETASFKALDAHSRKELKELYINYFYHRQDELWRMEAMKKLPGLKHITNMLVCGEDLGMVPHCVPELMQKLGILSLEIQRMPKKPQLEFFDPGDAPYLSVVTPSTHDMTTIRGWWEEDVVKTKRFYNIVLGQIGNPPLHCEPEINKEIVLQHLYSPAMWSIFQLQDLMGISEPIRRKDSREERINDPSDNNHIWNYRMHIYLEDLIKGSDFNEELKNYVQASGR